LKALTLLIFLLISFASLAQHNEVILSYQPYHKEIGNGGNVSYYRNISKNNAIGLKTGFYKFAASTFFYDAISYTTSIDFVHRHNFIKSKKIRLLGEIGISTNRVIKNAERSPVLGRPDASGFPSYLDKGWIKTNYLGLSSELGFDVSLFKIFNLGFGYYLKMYFLNDDDNTRERTRYFSNLNINLGYKF
jgi:hypothetical protein